MKRREGRRWIGCLALLAILVFAAEIVWAQNSPIEIENVPKIVGLGFGFAPDYVGSDHYKFVAAPFLRYQLAGTQRYFLVRATEVEFNMVDHPWLRLGPALNLRPGRSDVENDQVNRMKDIDWAIEAGAFIGAEFIDKANPRQRLILDVEFLQDVSGVHRGNLTTFSIRGWLPLSLMFDATLGVSTSLGSPGFMQTYFGVSAEDSLRSLLRPYSLSTGLRDVSVTPGIVMHLSKSWHVAGGLRYSLLVDGAEKSPVVEVGSKNQWIMGLAGAYSW